MPSRRRATPGSHSGCGSGSSTRSASTPRTSPASRRSASPARCSSATRPPIATSPSGSGATGSTGTYAFRSLVESGAVVVERLGRAGRGARPARRASARASCGRSTSGPPWRPEEAVTVEQALHAATVAPAWLAGRRAATREAAARLPRRPRRPRPRPGRRPGRRAARGRRSSRPWSAAAGCTTRHPGTRDVGETMFPPRAPFFSLRVPSTRVTWPPGRRSRPPARDGLLRCDGEHRHSATKRRWAARNTARRSVGRAPAMRRVVAVLAVDPRGARRRSAASGGSTARPRVTLFGDSVAAALAYDEARRGRCSRRASTSSSTRRSAAGSPRPGARTRATGRRASSRSSRSLREPLGSVVVIDVGYNDVPSDYGADLDRVMQVLVRQGVTTVIWVTMQENRPLYRTTNAAIAVGGDAAGRRSGSRTGTRRAGRRRRGSSTTGSTSRARARLGLARFLRPLVLASSCTAACQRAKRADD